MEILLCGAWLEEHDTALRHDVERAATGDSSAAHPSNGPRAISALAGDLPFYTSSSSGFTGCSPLFLFMFVCFYAHKSLQANCLMVCLCGW
jgi:hypothetical protein